MNLFLNAIKSENFSGKVPVWLMRQAGRYMSSYRALRSQHSFLELCHEPELITEVTLMPIKRFGFDAAILFSDILMIPEALGVGLHFEEGKGPIIHRPIQSDLDILQLPGPDISQLQFVAEGIKSIKANTHVPLIGFSGAPFTVASYMIEGGSSRDLKKTKKWMLRNPESFHKLLDLISEWTVDYLKMQIEAGVQAVQIFESWANYLAFPQFKEFSYEYLRKIVSAIGDRVPVILFSKGTAAFGKALASIKPSAISVDWNSDISYLRQELPQKIALQGNLDPDVLYADSSVIKREVNRILESMKGDPGFIFNLGHGILPDIPEESVEVLVSTVKAFNFHRR